jgi:glycosyltransferase involved in cell wall biosynthesis
MKILYGITKSNFGGAQRYVFELAVEAKKHGHNSTVLMGGTGPLAAKLQKNEVRVIALDTMQRDISIIKEIKSFFQIIRILRSEKPDVFHINSSKMGGLGALAGRLSGVKKIIFTSHGWAFNEPRPFWQKFIIKFFVWLTLLLSHKTICVSEETRNQILNLPLIKNKLIVIHNGIKDFPLLPSKPKKVLIVGVVAELHKIKGLDVLLRSWSKFVEKHEARLFIIGAGEEMERLTRLAQELEISDSIEFKGYVEDARSYLLDFDILVLPSRSENLPYTLLEAGLAGLPVIASSVGGIPEIIESGISGVLVPPEDEEVLFSSLILLSEDANLRKRLGIALKSSVQEKFSFDKMAQQTFATY